MDLADVGRTARQYGALIEAIGIAMSLAVTVVLAVIAGLALRAANRQAKASDAVTIEMRREVDESRRQHYLANVPIVKVARPWAAYDGPSPYGGPEEPHLAAVVSFYGSTEATALDLRVQMFGEHDDGTRSNHRVGEAVITMLAPGEDRTLHIETPDLLSLDYVAWANPPPPQVQSVGPEPPQHTYRRVRVVLTCRSPLGSTVEQEFRWHTARQYSDDYAWELLRHVIVPDPARPDDRVVVEPNQETPR